MTLPVPDAVGIKRGATTARTGSVARNGPAFVAADVAAPVRNFNCEMDGTAAELRSIDGGPEAAAERVLEAPCDARGASDCRRVAELSLLGDRISLLGDFEC